MSQIKPGAEPDETVVVTAAGQLAEKDETGRPTGVPVSAARGPATNGSTVSATAATAAGTTRPVRRSSTAPSRSPELAHLNLNRLRAYRRTLLDEELRTSYWRRLLQARRDLLRAGGEPGDRAALTDALTEARSLRGRQVILTLHPDGGMPILPHLPDLWASGVDQGTEAERAELFTRLASAESVLSSYREALHRRLDRATAELVARYHDDPGQCLVALPLAR